MAMGIWKSFSLKNTFHVASAGSPDGRSAGPSLPRRWRAVLTPSESGLRILGERKRGAATADWNQDGRLDLVIGQNNGQTMLLTTARQPRDTAYASKVPQAMNGALESNGDWWGTAAGPDLGRRSMQDPAMDHKMVAYRSLPGLWDEQAGSPLAWRSTLLTLA